MLTSDARSQLSPTKGAAKKSVNSTKDMVGPRGGGTEDIMMDKVVEEDGEDLRLKVREVGKANILAWGETRGRYLDE